MITKEVYQSVVEKAKYAATDLESKWEGSGRDTFVKEQDNAYHYQLAIVQGIMSTYEKIITACRQYVESGQRINEMINER